MAYFRKRGNKWSFTAYLGVDPRTGKKKQKTVSGFKTKKEAQLAAAKIEESVSTGEYKTLEKMTFSDFALKWEKLNKENFKSTTYSTYIGIIKNRLVPYFNNMYITDIRTIDIQSYYVELLEESLSTRYIRLIHNVLRRLFRDMIKWGLISKNVMGGVEPPKIQKKSYNVLDFAQAMQLLDYMKSNSKQYIFFSLAIWTGMRRGEMLGLRWQDIDFDKKEIYVQQQLAWTQEGFIFQSTKTIGSSRTIPIPDQLIKELKDYNLAQKKLRLQLGDAFKDYDLVVATSTGNYFMGRNLLYQLERACEELNLPKMTIHELRHTHATIMLQLGEHPKIVSERLGHKSIDITLNLYSHALPSLQRNASDNLQKAYLDHLKNTAQN
ncbi:site-specific integrase [Rummeliibacillus stabekisii]|uniref:site-specific integrase n=1 Tax=Rummeliibacillus stabekisii TaxID=241244 RepID=UPI00203EA301|nr:site-specific integrase [Rummeliibacillus stabekisii]MCM3316143.1 site-specific integrase [Rummeliibacillus stabekisii]